MPTTHLTKGSTCPPLKQDQMRVYNMKYCPFGQRTFLVLKAKNIDFDLVYINLFSKPEWYLEKFPGGKVPLLEHNENLLGESLITSEFLDEAYPEPPLYPSDPWKKGSDRVLIDSLSSKLVSHIHGIYNNHNDEDMMRASFAKASEGLSFYENELVKRKSLFFGGDRAGMLDYMMWPWLERLPILENLLKSDNLNLVEKFPVLMEYVGRMKKDKAVARDLMSVDVHWQYIKSRVAGNPVYDR